MSTLHEASPVEAIDRRRRRPRTYEVRTFGCQMNVHDSERLSGSLEAAGYVPADGAEPDIVVINTCAVRENADNKLYGNLGHLAGVKRRHEGMQIAVGGCLAQKDKNVILEKAPWVDVVFGTHNMGSLPSLLERARHNDEAQLEILESLEVFPSTLPDQARLHLQRLGVDLGRLQQHLHLLHRARAPRQGEGPPARRHPRRDPGARRRRRHRGDPARPERQLLRRRVRRPAGVRQAAARRRRRSRGSSASASRARTPPRSPTTSSTRWPRRPRVMPQLHMPLQSGSDRILKAMRRSYRSEKFLGILDRVRARIPNAAISHRHHRRLPRRDRGGLPGDAPRRRGGPLRLGVHLPVLDPPRHARRDHGRPGAEGGRAGALRAPRSRCRSASPGRRTSSSSAAPVEVLVSTGEGKKDAETHRLSGRAEDSRLVHFEVPAGSELPRPGDVVSVDDHPGRAVPPHRRLRSTARRCASAAPAPATRGTARRPRAAACPRRRRGIRRRRASRSACRRCASAAPSRSSAPGVGTMPIYDPTDAQR